jgi:TetR/AcrR family transcriptional repressor of lmrAB and yxaGH operons
VAGETRQRFLRTAANLFQRQGYHATGLNQVVTEGRAPKGSLYFHFPGGKEQLAAEAVTAGGASLGARMAAAVADAGSAGEAVTALGRFFATRLLESDFTAGCPVATIALEASASADIRAACDGAYGEWLAGIAAVLARHGVPSPSADAQLVLSAVEGALLLARVRRDATVVTDVTTRLAHLLEQP